MNAGWIVLAFGIALAVVLLVTSSRRRYQQVGLGTVSHQWMAEQRAGQGHDSQR